MNLATQSHPGLPVVPHPAAGELLGSWLLKVANIYGLSLNTLLIRLGAVPAMGRKALRWYELHQGQLDMTKLACALRRSTESVAAMAPPQCSRRWPAEMGFCGHCLEELTSSGGRRGWLRRWMHPMSLACGRHRSWLEPVATNSLAKIDDADAFARLPSPAPPLLTLELKRESALIDSALWLEELVTNPDEHFPPWGKTDRDQLANILLSLITVLTSPAAADMVRHQLSRSPRDIPEPRQQWAVQTLRIDDGVGGALILPAPHRLRHRQFVFGLLGNYLRLHPENRGPLEPINKLIALAIPPWRLARWPPAALQWVSPRAQRQSGRRKRRATPAPLFGV
jgi:hypothetical protein